MSDEWVETTLGDLLTLEYGKALPEKSRDGRGYPVLGSAGVVGLHSEPSVAGPGIVVGRKGTAGSVTWVDTDFSPIDTTYWVRLKGDVVSLDFAFLVLSAVGLPGICAQTGVPGLNRDRAYEVHVQIPPLPVQRRIVDVMAHLDAHVANLRTEREEALGLADAMNEALSGNLPMCKVADVAHPDRGLVGGPFGSSLVSKDYTRDGIPVIRGVNMPKSGRYLEPPFVYVSEDKAETLRRNMAFDGDVIFTQRGTLGQVGLVGHGQGPLVVSQSQMRLRPDPAVALAEYVYYAFARPSMARRIKSLSTATANPHINLGILATIEFPLPSLDEQKRVVATLGCAYDEVVALDRELAALGSSRDALLSDMLKGTVRPKTPDDDTARAAS